MPAVSVTGVIHWNSGPDDAAMRDALERPDAEASRRQDPRLPDFNRLL